MQITSGKLQKAQRVVVYGPEGIGKSTLASYFPNPVFLDTEGSTNELDVNRTPTPNTWADLMNTLNALVLDTQGFNTFILDTADWAETLACNHVCLMNHKPSMEDFGFGKGYVFLEKEWENLLGLLGQLIAKGVNVVLTAHAALRKFEQPDELGSYDRYELKLKGTGKVNISAKTKEWADMVLFANYKTYVEKEEGSNKAKARGGQRVIFTSHHPAWDAKNRHGLPEVMPLPPTGLPPELTAVIPVFQTSQKTPAAAPVQETTGVTVPDEPGDQIEGLAPATDYADDQVTQVQKTGTDEQAAQPETNEGTVEQSEPMAFNAALYEVMQRDQITEAQVTAACELKGYVEPGTPLGNYPEAFVIGSLVPAWESVKAVIETLKTEGKLV